MCWSWLYATPICVTEWNYYLSNSTSFPGSFQHLHCSTFIAALLCEMGAEIQKEDPIQCLIPCKNSILTFCIHISIWCKLVLFSWFSLPLSSKHAVISLSSLPSIAVIVLSLFIYVLITIIFLVGEHRNSGGVLSFIGSLELSATLEKMH